MQAIRPIQIILMILMLVAAAGAYYLTPTIKMAEQRKVNLEQMIPQQFGDWKMLPNQIVIELPPELAANLSRIYTETLSRTYVNSKGQQVMLSIAYGADQSDGMGVHRPEVCYPAQGFNVLSRVEEPQSENNKSQVKLLTKLGERIEPITYWMIIADQRVITNRQHKLVQLKQGLKGQISDGLIFRVSSLGANKANEWKLQAEFIDELQLAVPTKLKGLFFGQ